MTREQDFAEASTQFDGIYAQVAFSTGCEHGYQYAVDKACEWLYKNLHLVRDWSGSPASNYRELVRMFRKAMEE